MPPKKRVRFLLPREGESDSDDYRGPLSRSPSPRPFDNSFGGLSSPGRSSPGLSSRPLSSLGKELLLSQSPGESRPKRKRRKVSTADSDNSSAPAAKKQTLSDRGSVGSSDREFLGSVDHDVAPTWTEASSERTDALAQRALEQSVAELQNLSDLRKIEEANRAAEKAGRNGKPSSAGDEESNSGATESSVAADSSDLPPMPLALTRPFPGVPPLPFVGETCRGRNGMRSCRSIY